VAPVPTARQRLAVVAGRAAGVASRVLGRGAGEVVTGRVALRLDPLALARAAQRRRLVLVSGTNGKTTTTRLLAAAMGTAGPVLSNGGGANMPEGILTALLASKARAGALEVDELHLPAVARAVRPAVLVLLNLSRDQLDRSNETRRLSRLWRDLVTDLSIVEDPPSPSARDGAAGCVQTPVTVVANADDPLVVWAARPAGDRVRWVAAGQPWTADAMVCPRCAHLLNRGDVAEPRPGAPSAAGVAAPAEAAPHSGADWWCTHCGLRRPTASVTVTPTGACTARLSTAEGTTTVSLQLPGRCNLANAAVAVSAAVAVGVPLGTAAAALPAVRSVQGRYSTGTLAGVPVRLLLAKNPAGWVEMLDLVDELGPRTPVLVHFHARGADGRDPSWIWDVPVRRLLGHPVAVSGERAADVLLRLATAGVHAEAVSDPEAGAIRVAALAGHGVQVQVLATYTAFREVAVEIGALR